MCTACAGRCLTCSSAIFCESCNAGYLVASTGVCEDAADCPDGTYPENSNNTCNDCTEPCDSCHTIATNCTSCVLTHHFYSNVCYVTCPDGTYEDGGNCLDCVAPCNFCTSSTFCTSCSTGYLVATPGTCVTGVNCPVGTFPFNGDMTCATCTSPCDHCSMDPTNCTSCITDRFLHSNDCLEDCPATTFEDVNVCSPCAGRCQTCSSLTFCESCNTGFLVAATGVCEDAADCPDGTYP